MSTWKKYENLYLTNYSLRSDNLTIQCTRPRHSNDKSGSFDVELVNMTGEVLGYKCKTGLKAAQLAGSAMLNEYLSQTKDVALTTWEIQAIRHALINLENEIEDDLAGIDIKADHPECVTAMRYLVEKFKTIA